MEDPPELCSWTQSNLRFSISNSWRQETKTLQKETTKNVPYHPL